MRAGPCAGMGGARTLNEPAAMPWFDRLLRPELSTLRPYHPSAPGHDAVRLDANESPHGLSPAARERFAEALAQVPPQRYPDARATKLREAIAAREGCHPDDLVLGCGSDEVIALIIQALSAPRPGRDRAATLHVDPSFVMYGITTRASGNDPVAVALDEHWDLDVGAMADAVERHAPSVVFLPSPNNPTGNAFDRARIAAVIEATREKALVVLDEAYGRFAGLSYRAEREAHEHVAQLGTLSKVGFAAARVGWAVLPRGLAAFVDRARQPYNLNAYSQRIGELALGELAGEVDATVARIVAERARVSAALRAVPGVRFDEPAANFFWLDVGRDASAVQGALAERGVLVRAFSGRPRLERYLRVTVGSPDENDRFLAALRAVLSA